jgi:hypothetical protein
MATLAAKSGSLKSANERSEAPIFIGSTGQSKPTDRWRIVAGPELSATSFRLATLEPHPRIKWDMGNTASIGKTSTPINIIGGYRFL